MGDQLQQHKILRRQVSRFLSGQYGSWRGLHRTLGLFRENGWPAFLFGGLLRDLMSPLPMRSFRDVDIVVDTTRDELSAAFSPFIRRYTRFGGLHLRVDGWMFDVWPLSETWAFRQNLAPACFCELPRTTFLNVEAVVVELFPRPGRPRTIFDSGFFEAITRGILEINLEENLSPELCVVRSLITASRLRFRIGANLGKYILRQAERISSGDLTEVQRSHYGRALCSEKMLQSWIEHIDRSLPQNKVINLLEEEQLELWADTSAAR